MNRIETKKISIEDRLTTFNEVDKGYSKEDAITEASRCLNCKVPRCTGACPVGINIPAFINAIKSDNIDLAYKIITDANSLPGVCGRVCPQEATCEGACVKGIKGDPISIGALERYVADNAKKSEYNVSKQNNKKVLIIGSGPSGLSCAGVLVKLGYKVTIYESLHEAGGVLSYGIPEFRLPKTIIKSEIERLKQMGVEIVLNMPVGASLNLDKIKEEYDALYIATGAGLPNTLNVSGINANGVYFANEILTRINLMGAYKENSLTPIIKDKKVFVIGGGNVALDAARSLKRLNCDVKIIYRRSIDKMPARKVEIKHALEEGIEIVENTNISKINVDDENFIKSVTLVKYDDELKEIEGSYYDETVDSVVLAIGTKINDLVLKNTNISKDDKGLIIVDSSFKTNEDNIYAGGDAVSGSATVISACNHGINAAHAIDLKLNNN